MKTENLNVVENRNENGTYYTVVTDDGMPINRGHFTSENDANELIKILTEGNFTVNSDQAGGVCLSMDSWIEV